MVPKVLCVIMGGGRGTRLHPLTKQRCKPAVPLAGKYRLVDIPISNCLNSGMNRLYVLSQFNTASLHRHIQDSYKFDPFGGGFVDILSAEQTEDGDYWYQGTADAVRQNLHHFNDHDHDLILILSGDQLYRMDFREIVRQHIQTGADVTVSAKPFPASDVSGLGLMRVSQDLQITEFVEKPTDPRVIESLVMDPEIEDRDSESGGEPRCLASMGIYVFNREILRSAIANEMADFGKEVIPSLLGKAKLYSFIFDNYWEDIGTVRAFFEANLDLTNPLPRFNFFMPNYPIYTHARYLPASKINRCALENALVADGCIITDARVTRSVIGVRSFINEQCELDNVVVMGADYFESDENLQDCRRRDVPEIGIGAGSRISNAIIDKNARIGKNVVLSPEGKPDLFQSDGVVVRDGVLVVTKNAVIPDNTEI
jgi:glucose-1-phosphate adenylyltransferase